MSWHISFRPKRALFFCFALAAFLVSRSARADELKLKDGTKISGTIVGFEDNSFKVKTTYGFAVVQKDQVVSISMSDAPKSAPPDKKAAPAAEKTPAPEKPNAEPAKTSAPAPPVATADKPAELVATKPAMAPAASTAPAAPPKPAAPEPIRENVSGNTYTNETYRFRMYKPPDWDVIASASALLPGAIAAMGTADETTYLLIGQEPAGKSLADGMDATDRRLRDVMENFRPLDEERITVSGAVAIEHRFRGNADEHDWSGVVVLFVHGDRLYTIFGMTRADSDLVQIQENVIARTIASLEFIEQ